MYANVFTKNNSYIVLFDKKINDGADYCIYIPFYEGVSSELTKNIVKYIKSNQYERGKMLRINNEINLKENDIEINNLDCHVVDIPQNRSLMNLKHFLRKFGTDHHLKRYYKIMEKIYSVIQKKTLDYTSELNKVLQNELQIKCKFKNGVIEIEDECGIKIIVRREENDYINGVPLHVLESKINKNIISQTVIITKLEFGGFTHEHEEVFDRRGIIVDILKRCVKKYKPFNRGGL